MADSWMETKEQQEQRGDLLLQIEQLKRYLNVSEMKPLLDLSDSLSDIWEKFQKLRGMKSQ